MRRPLVALVLAAVTLAALLPARAGATGGRERAARGDMVRLPAGSYLPLYGEGGRAARVRVDGFALDRRPVTRGEFLAFVRAHPQWRRDRVRPLFAERGYLAGWPSATDAGDAAARATPVTEVSWFAARAYCQAQGKRLPTVDEWEYAAAASATARDAAREPAFVARLVSLYTAPRPTPRPAAGTGERNAWGLRDLHGRGWEWTLDFNSVLISDDSRGTGSGVKEGDHGLWCASGALGATDPSNYPAFLRYAVRAGLTGRTTMDGLGFRCAA